MKAIKASVFFFCLVAFLGAGPVSGDRRDFSSGSVSIIAMASPQSTAEGTGRTGTKSEAAGAIKFGLAKQEIDQIMKLHNEARADVGVGPLEWSDELAAYAEEWAERLKATGCGIEHRPSSGKYRQKYGENLYIGTARVYGVEDAVKAWVSEKKYYRGDPLSASNFKKTGHYTQIVWRDTARMGCAKVECNGNMIVVCNYDPPGNVIGRTPY